MDDPEAQVIPTSPELTEVSAGVFELRLPRVVTIEAELHLALQRAELAWVRSVVAEIESGKLHWDREFLRHHFEMTRAEHPAKKGETE